MRAGQDRKLVELECDDEINCVAFDAVGTLIFADPPVPRAYFEIARQYGSSLTQSQIAVRFHEAYRLSESAVLGVSSTDIDSQYLVTSEDLERKRWKKIAVSVLDDVENFESFFDELYDYFSRPTAWECFDDVHQTLETLKARGYRLAMASNFDRRLNSVCDGLRQLDAIELRVISSLIGHRKPSESFYGAILEQSGCRAEETVMVGDDYQNDVVAARRCGMRAVHLQRVGTFDSHDERTISTLRELIDILK